MRREVWARSYGLRSDKSLPLPTHLPRSLHIHKLLKNPMGLGDQFCSWPGLLELLTGQPEFQVLLAELGLQEGEECSHPICGCGGRWKGREIGRSLGTRTAEERKKGSNNVRVALTNPQCSSITSWRLSALRHADSFRGNSDIKEKCLGNHSNNDYGRAWSLLISRQWSLPDP